MAVEMIGGYKVTPLKDGKYSVAVTNGNFGAKVLNKAEYEAFKAKYNKQQDTVEISGKKSGTAAKIAKGMASASCPGLGQIIDGRFKDGVKDMGKVFGLGLAGTAIGLAGYMNFVKAVEKGGKAYGFYGALAACAAIGVAAIANWAHSIKDAYQKG